MVEMDEKIELYNLKKECKYLSSIEGNGTSLITLLIHPKKQLSEITQKLTDEIGKAACIKDRQNRHSVEDALVSVRERLKLLKSIPLNGLAVFCGFIKDSSGKVEKVMRVIVPPKILMFSFYYCDKRFHVEELEAMICTDIPVAFIVIDGSGVLYAIVKGDRQEVLKTINVELPKKHNKGGQSAPRFERLRTEKRNNFLKKAAETANILFLNESGLPTVNNLFIAGSSLLKNELKESENLSKNLRAIIADLIDTSYGGRNGLNQAVQASTAKMTSLRFVKEKIHVTDFMQGIAKDNRALCYGVASTMQAIEARAVSEILVHEELDCLRLILKIQDQEELLIEYLSANQMNDSSYIECLLKKHNASIVESEPLLDWLIDNYGVLSIKLHLISDKSPEGHQFAKTFGIACKLRFEMDVSFLEKSDEEEKLDIDEDFI